MDRKFDLTLRGDLAATIMLNPLSYIHPERLRLSCRLNTPQQRAIVNQMLLAGIAGSQDWMAAAQYARQLLPHWHQLPYVCTLVGAQLMKQDLAWRGRILKLPAAVRFFISLPLQDMGAAPANMFEDIATSAFDGEEKNPLLQVQAVGLSRVLDWQQQAPVVMLGMMRLLFSPKLDNCFEHARKPLETADLLLILQAMLYAKNPPNPV